MTTPEIKHQGAAQHYFRLHSSNWKVIQVGLWNQRNQMEQWRE